MELAKFLWMILEGILVGICLVFTACKIFKTKITDWFPVTIWGLATSLWVMGIINVSYYKYGVQLHIFLVPIVETLKTIVYINAVVLFWVFCWGIFLISIEVQERLSQRSHWFKRKFRKTLNILVLLLIFTSFITAAVYDNNITDYSFLII